MRTRACLALAPLLALVPLACVTENNPSAPSADGGVTPYPEAGAFDVTAPDTSVDDSAAPDASDAADTNVPDAGPAPTSVTVLKGGAPEPGITVVFNDSTGAVVDTLTTDATGRVTRIVTSGSLVTVVMGTVAEPRLFTIGGVEPGDTLVANDDPLDVSTQYPIVHVQPANSYTGALNYGVYAGDCSVSITDSAGDLALEPSCVRNGKFPLLLIAQNSDFQPLAFLFQKGNTLVNDTTYAANGTWSTDTTTQTIQATNVPDDASNILVYDEVADGVSFDQSMYAAPADPDAGVASGDFVTHPGYPDWVQRESHLVRTASNYTTLRAVATRAAAPSAASTVSLDLSKLLPEISGSTLDAADPARPQVAFTTASPVTGADANVVRLEWTVISDAGEYTSGSWTFMSPPDQAGAKAPAMPASVQPYLNKDAANYTSPPFVMVVDGSAITSYAQARAASAVFSPTLATIRVNTSRSLVPPLPVDGTVRMSALTQYVD